MTIKVNIRLLLTAEADPLFIAVFEYHFPYLAYCGLSYIFASLFLGRFGLVFNISNCMLFTNETLRESLSTITCSFPFKFVFLLTAEAR